MTKVPSNKLLFIPDISGFTDFVNDNEIAHSQHIIEELLETLIDANVLDLKLSEIEGDAILFYSDELPTSGEIFAQISKMFVDFHTHLRRYEQNRICQCGACATATNLSLKFVLHFGQVGDKQVKDHSKLFGREVIVAHRLLKNGVESNQYALFSESLIRELGDRQGEETETWSNPQQGKEEYDTGLVHYVYYDLNLY